MRRVFGLFILLAVLLTGVQAGASPAVRLATFEYPPYVQQIDGQARGLAVELVREAFARMKRSVVIEFYPFSRGIRLLDAGAVDGFFTIKRTPEREVRLSFPHQPLLSQDYLFFVKKAGGVRFHGDFADLSGATIGVVSSVSYGPRFDGAVRLGSFAKLERASSYELIFRMLAGGRVDAVICSRLVGLEFVRRIGALGRVEISGPTVESVPSHLVFAPGQEGAALARSFDSAIAAMKRDGSFERLVKRYGEEPRL